MDIQTEKLKAKLRQVYTEAAEKAVCNHLAQSGVKEPCWICDKCGWIEKQEMEVWCWKCGGTKGGQMVYKGPTKET